MAILRNSLERPPTPTHPPPPRMGGEGAKCEQRLRTGADTPWVFNRIPTNASHPPFSSVRGVSTCLTPGILRIGTLESPWSCNTGTYRACAHCSVRKNFRKSMTQVINTSNSASLEESLILDSSEQIQTWGGLKESKRPNFLLVFVTLQSMLCRSSWITPNKNSLYQYMTFYLSWSVVSQDEFEVMPPADGSSLLRR